MITILDSQLLGIVFNIYFGSCERTLLIGQIPTLEKNSLKLVKLNGKSLGFICKEINLIVLS